MRAFALTLIALLLTFTYIKYQQDKVAYNSLQTQQYYWDNCIKDATKYHLCDHGKDLYCMYQCGYISHEACELHGCKKVEAPVEKGRTRTARG